MLILSRQFHFDKRTPSRPSILCFVEEENLATMIKYTKGIFGLNLLFRVHGSAIYRAVLPAILAAITFILIYHFWDKDPQSVLLHPYAAGVLIGGITFLLVFRVTQSYGRYCKFSAVSNKRFTTFIFRKIE